MSKTRSPLRLLIPGATVFLSSGCIMILAVVASRLVARALGSSLYTWTFVAVVALSGLALGSIAGGRIADRFHVRRILSVLFAVSSAACVALVIVNNVISDWTWLWQLSWPVHVVFHICLVFLIPLSLLGAVGPVVVKMALDQGLGSGRTLGILFAWAAAGCVVGILLAGFFLIANFGSTVIVWAIGAVLLALAFLYWVSCWVLYLWAMIFAALAAMGMAPADWAREGGLAAGLREPNDPSVLYQEETPYHHISVRRVSEKPDKRTLWLDQRLGDEIVMSDVDHVRSFHTEVWAALTHGLSESDRPLAALVISGGGYSFPRYLKAVRPDSHVEVVEIDPGVTEAAAEAFGLPRDTTIQTVNVGARYYLSQLVRGRDRPDRRYDFVYTNVIDDYAVSFDWMTMEFNEDVAALLSDGGVYLISLVDTFESGRFLGAVVHTLEQTFSHVWAIGSRAGSSGLPGTYVVAATQRTFDPKRILTEYNKHLVFSVLDESEMTHLKDCCGELVLTDDYAPVESMQTAAVRSGARRQLARRYLREAARLHTQDRYERSIARYRQVAEHDPSEATRAYDAIGLVRLEQGDLEGAAQAFEQAIENHIETGLQQALLASVHVNFGTLLQKMGKPAEARAHWTEAARRLRIDLERSPESVYVWESLGDTLVLAGQLNEAVVAFEKAIALDPEHLDYYRKLVRVLEVQKRYDEAIAVARRQLDLLKEQDRHDAVLEMSQYIDLLEYRKVKQ